MSKDKKNKTAPTTSGKVLHLPVATYSPPISAYHHDQNDDHSNDISDLKSFTIGDLTSSAAVVATDEKKSVDLFIAAQAQTRTRTITFRASDAILLSPEELPSEDVEWIKVQANTSLEHLINKYGNRLLFYFSHRKQQNVTIFAWDVVSNEDRTTRVLVRKEKKQ